MPGLAQASGPTPSGGRTKRPHELASLGCEGDPVNRLKLARAYVRTSMPEVLTYHSGHRIPLELSIMTSPHSEPAVTDDQAR